MICQRRVRNSFNSSQFLDPRSELSVTLVAIATRIGHKIGLHRTGADPHMPFFEEEMRLRVWWPIMCLESRARRKALGLTPSQADHGQVRMPMNVNDADLHPHMAKSPTAGHLGATEMLYCLWKYEIAHYVRSWPTGAAIANTTTTNLYELLASTSPESMTRKRKVLTDLWTIYEDKYLRQCDPSIPLHHLSATVAQFTIHRVRFWFYHPRHQPEGGWNMSQEDQDVVFESSIQLLQLGFDLGVTNFSAHLLEHLQGCIDVEALVYMVSQLRQRVSGDLVRTAWALVGRIYEEYHLQLLQNHDKFYTALADLTLQAWEARRQEVDAQGDTVPEFIGLLQGMRGNVGHEDAPTAVTEGMTLNGEFQFGLMPDDPLDWAYWNELLQL